jgi:hypothetical protein
MNRRGRAILASLFLGFLAPAAQPQTSVPFDSEKLEKIWNQAHLKSDRAYLTAAT